MTEKPQTPKPEEPATGTTPSNTSPAPMPEPPPTATTEEWRHMVGESERKIEALEKANALQREEIVRLAERVRSLEPTPKRIFKSGVLRRRGSG